MQAHVSLIIYFSCSWNPDLRASGYNV